MAKNVVWDAYYTGTLSVTESDSTWTLAQGSVIFGAGIRQENTFANDKIVVNGGIDNSNAVGVYAAGAQTRVVVAAGGFVSGTYAIQTLGAKAEVINNGALKSTSYGIQVEGANSEVTNGSTGTIIGGSGIHTTGINASVVNNGQIFAANNYGIFAEGAGSIIINNGFVVCKLTNGIASIGGDSIINGSEGVIQSLRLIVMVSVAGEVSHIINHGRITTADPVSILSTAGNDRIINDGEINGSIMTGSGNDTIDVRGGAKIGGAILGEAGDDTLITDNAKFSFAAGDGAAGDVDTIKATVSYTLINAVDNLVLMGSKNLKGSGNEVANVMKGNVGDNVLKGMAGTDTLDGGKGSDTLYGGVDADTFRFFTGSGKDEIKDFHRTENDVIDVHKWKGIDNLADVKSHAKDHGSDVWITVGHDVLVIDHIHKGDLAAGDFHF